MTEFKLIIEAPALADAINALAAAIQSRPAAPVEVKAPRGKKTEAAAPASVPQAPAAPIPAPAVVPAPVATPAPVAAPVPAAPVAATAPQTVPVVPATPAPAPVYAAPVVPQAPAAPAAKSLSLDVLANAGASLLEKGMMQQLLGLLGQFGVQSVTALRPDQYPAFADGLRTLGAVI